MIFYPADGTPPREISDTELKSLMIAARKKITPSTPIHRFDQIEDDDLALETIGGWPFLVDRRQEPIRKLYRQHARRNWPSLRSVLISVSVAALAGFIFAGLF